MFRTDRRGVSEVLGFVLVFSLVVASVGIVYTVGVGGLQDVRDAERVTNAERAFDVLAENNDAVLRGEAPSRGTEIQLADADLRVADPVVMNVTGTTADGTDETITGDRRLHPVEYSAGDERLRYVGGAVIRESGDGAVMLRDPPFVLEDTRALIPLYETRPGDRTAVGGDVTTRVRIFRTAPPTVQVPDRERYVNVTVRMNTTSPEPWAEYFEGQGFACSTGVPEADLRCEPGPDHEYDYVEVVSVRAIVEFE